MALTWLQYNLLVLILISIPARLFSQDVKISETIVSIAEQLAAEDPDPESAGSYIERLHELAEDPVNLNSADENELGRLFFLTDFQVKALADYSHSAGRIVSVFEIGNIPGFDRETVEMMVPFIVLEAPREKTLPGRFYGVSVTNFSMRTTDRDTSYSGPPWKVLTKYRLSSGALSLGFTAEKDPGEKFLTGSPPLPDFFSLWMAYSGKGIIRKVVIGDFSARIGQGTNMNTGVSNGLSLTAPGYMNGKNEIRQYTSTDENNFLRGAAMEFSARNLTMSIFYSVNKLDATFNPDSNQIENFYQSGLHNTISGRMKKDAVTDLSMGINLSYVYKNIRTGLAWTGDRLSYPVVKAGSGPAELYNFSGDANGLYTIYYNTIIKRFLFYGELSLNNDSRHAFTQGMTLRPSDRLSVSCFYRNYQPGYFSLHGKAAGNSLGSWNENSILANFTFEAAKHLFVSAGCDIRHFPWLKYRSCSPSNAVKRELRMKYLPTDKLAVELLYDYRYSTTDNNDDPGIPSYNETITRGIKGSVKYSPEDRLVLGTRIDFKTAVPEGSKGMLLLQDVSYTFRKIPVTFWLRYCTFKTGSWDTRLYTYENDLLYSFSIPVLSGEGSRSYLMVKWKIAKFAELRFRYAITSAKEQWHFEHREEYKIQVKINF